MAPTSTNGGEESGRGRTEARHRGKRCSGRSPPSQQQKVGPQWVTTLLPPGTGLQDSDMSQGQWCDLELHQTLWESLQAEDLECIGDPVTDLHQLL